MYKILTLLLALGMVCSLVQIAEAGTVTLGWDPNSETDLAGYRLYYGNSPRSNAPYTQNVTINNSAATTHQITLPNGTYYFALTAFNLSGLESGFSNEVTAQISDPVPPPPDDPPPPDPPGQPGRPMLQ